MHETRKTSTRKSTYLVQSKSGVYYFRWNVLVNGKHHQPRVSLRTRDYLEALSLSSDLGKTLRSIPQPSVQQIKDFYKDYFLKKTEERIKVNELNISNLLTDLAPKSQREYLSCWDSFIEITDNSELLVTELRESHIANWKARQSCSETTLKKKLRLLSSCFQKASIPSELSWFRFKVKKLNGTGRRALTHKEIAKIFEATRRFEFSSEHWRFYLPRMALLTGCRLNELAQLRVSDVLLEAEQSIISINANESDQRTKNDASVRAIPLTDTTKSLLLPLVGQKNPKRRLFEVLPYNELNGYAGKPSKYFSGLIKQELSLSGVSFHSFRHSAVTHLFNSGVREELIGELMGHSTGRTTSGKIYMSGFQESLRLHAMEHLSELYNSLYSA